MLLRASISVPVIFPGVEVEGRRRVDGVVSDPLLVAVACDAAVVWPRPTANVQAHGRMAAIDAATHTQHNGPMKTALLPRVRVEPKLRADVESVLNEGETLSEFVEATVRSAVEFRRMQMEFQARADAAWKRFQKTGKGRPAEGVVAALQAKLDARRRELQGKHEPADR